MKKLMTILALIPFLGFGGRLDYTTSEVNTILGHVIPDSKSVKSLLSVQPVLLVENTQELANNYQTVEVSDNGWDSSSKSWGAATRQIHVHPDRRDLGTDVYNLSISMPIEDYTNGLVFWMDASTPIANEGTTSAVWADASTSQNDATQTGTSYQPDRTFTNGAWVWDFDLVDDQLIVDNDLPHLGSNDFDIAFTLSMKDVTSKGVFGRWGHGSGQNEWSFMTQWNGVLSFGISEDGSFAERVFISNPSKPMQIGQKHEVLLQRRAGIFYFTIDGTTVTSTNHLYALPDSNRTLKIGNADGYASRCGLTLYEMKIKVFD